MTKDRRPSQTEEQAAKRCRPEREVVPPITPAGDSDADGNACTDFQRFGNIEGEVPVKEHTPFELTEKRLHEGSSSKREQDQ